MITFQKIPPQEIEQLPAQAVQYLQNAIDRTPASTSRLDVTLDIAKKGYGNIYLIYSYAVLVGAAYILVYDTPEGKVVAPVLLGGDNMDSWYNDAWVAIMEFSRLSNAQKMCFVARKGWKKIYPKSRVIGYIYECDVEEMG